MTPTGTTIQTLIMSNLGALSVAGSQPGRLTGHGDLIAQLGQERDGSMADFTIEQLEAVNKTQAEKIKRLQVAMGSLMKSYREVDYAYWWDRHAPGRDTYTPVTIEDYGLLPGDMEVTGE